MSHQITDQTTVEVVTSRLNRVRDLCEPEEKMVLDVLIRKWTEEKKVTQNELARIVKGIGFHEKHEGHLELPKHETTLRKIRGVIRTLRVDHKVPILSDKHGYWLPWNVQECKTYVENMEKRVKAQTAAFFETYRAMEHTVGIHSDFFERQLKLC